MCEFEEQCKSCAGDPIAKPTGSCARYFVASNLGVDKIPAEMDIRDFDWAAAVIRGDDIRAERSKAGRIRLVLVGGDSFLDQVIEGVEKSDKSHVAGYLFDSVLEATGLKEPDDPYPGCWLHDPRKYDGNPEATFFYIDVPDLEAAMVEARRLIGRPYDVIACAKGGMKELFDTNSAGNRFAVNCSETWTRILQAGGTDLWPGVAPDCITPGHFRDYQMSLAKA
jgi:hypothetical protein